MPVCEALQRNPVRNAGYCFGYDFKSPSGMPPSLGLVEFMQKFIAGIAGRE
jgi:hypothetical protein